MGDVRTVRVRMTGCRAARRVYGSRSLTASV